MAAGSPMRFTCSPIRSRCDSSCATGTDDESFSLSMRALTEMARVMLGHTASRLRRTIALIMVNCIECSDTDESSPAT